MAAKVVCVASAKGGSGKTSLTATLGTFLARLGKKVLLIDADVATNGLSLLYLKELNAERLRLLSHNHHANGLQDALFGDHKCDVLSLSERLHVIPATYRLDISLGDDFSMDTLLTRMHDVVERYRSDYDYIWIDAQAGADQMSQVGMNARVSDEIIIVTEYDPMSAAGVERLKAALRDDLSFERTWILVNKLLPEFAQSVSQFLEVVKYLPPIPWDAEVVRAYARRRLAIDSDAGAAYTLSVIATLEALLGEAVQQDMTTWIGEQAATIRQPIETQYQDAETEMAAVIRQMRANKKRSALLQVSVLGGALSTMLLATVGVLRRDFVYSSGGGLVFMYTVVSAAAVSVVAIGWSIVTRRKSSVEAELEEGRLVRQTQLLEDRLKRLELLRTLDAKSLLKQDVGVWRTREAK